MARGLALTRLPEPATWTYRVYFGDFDEQREVAKVEFRWRHERDRYELRSEGSAVGLTAWVYSGQLLQVSRGRLGAQGLEPEHYAEQRGRRAERAVRFDRAAEKVAFGESRDVPLPAGIQDRLSSLMQLGWLAQAAPERFAVGAIIEIPEASTGAIGIARYQVRERSPLRTPDGDWPAIHLARERGAGANEPEVEIWLGRERSMVPIRIRLTDRNGRVLDQLIEPPPR